MRITFTFIAILFLSFISYSQTTILDFETPDKSTVFQYFGSPLDGTTNSVIANPNPTGLNTSAKVSKFVKPPVAEVWAGAFTNPNPNTLIDVTSDGKITVKVHMDHIGNMALKLEGSTDGGDNWVTKVANTKINEWEELTFDTALPSEEAPNKPAKGHIYTRIVVFFDFGVAGSGTEVSFYLDDIKTSGGAALVCQSILDYETADQSTPFQYFGSNLDGTTNSVIDNPNPTGLNTSAKVSKFVKPAVAEVWAGAFTNPNPIIPVDMVTNSKIKIKVHMDHIGNLALKFEGAADGGPNWVTKVANTKINEWEELTFDAALPSEEAPNMPAKGHIYSRIVLFFDFGTAGTGTDVNYYFDDICQIGSSGPTSKKVNFAVDMNNYSANFDKVYLSGVFNNWAGDANVLADADADGIWTGSLDLPVGLYEYKVTLDNWAAQESFKGTEECTVSTVGQNEVFTNRKLVVSGDTDVPKFCFNSCYACGEEVLINFKLGMGTVVPSPDGVWIAGGGNFDNPGGKYKMSDANNDKIYELTVPRKKGFSSYFTFTNGPCPDYSCKELITGLPCSNPNNFDDRFLGPITANKDYATCFGLCTDNALCTPSSSKDLSITTDLFDLIGNPSTGSSQIIFKANAGTKKLVISNAVGKVVQTLIIGNSDIVYDLNTESLTNGIYQITMISSNKMQTNKLIKI